MSTEGLRDALHLLEGVCGFAAKRGWMLPDGVTFGMIRKDVVPGPVKEPDYYTGNVSPEATRAAIQALEKRYCMKETKE